MYNNWFYFYYHHLCCKEGLLTCPSSITSSFVSQGFLKVCKPFTVHSSDMLFPVNSILDESQTWSIINHILNSLFSPSLIPKIHCYIAILELQYCFIKLHLYVLPSFPTYCSLYYTTHHLKY